MANCVQKIRDKSLPTQLRSIKSTDNPTDLACKGADAKGLISCTLVVQSFYHHTRFLRLGHATNFYQDDSEVIGQCN